MSDIDEELSQPGAADDPDGRLQGAVIVAAIPDQPVRVLLEAAHFAGLMKAPLVVVNVDVTRFVTYEDPDGYVHSAPMELNIAPGAAELDQVRRAAAGVLDPTGIEWTLRQLVGDPAIAIKQLADQIDAKLLVVGTRKRGIGESIREFFTGSVAARLAHRQHRLILVVPLGEAAADHEELWIE